MRKRAWPPPGTTSGPVSVFFHTGHGGLWGTDNERYAAGEPGPGLALAGWLADHRVVLTGCDTWSFGPYPPENPDAPFAVPQLLIVRHGVVVVETLGLPTPRATASANSCWSFPTPNCAGPPAPGWRRWPS